MLRKFISPTTVSLFILFGLIAITVVFTSIRKPANDNPFNENPDNPSVIQHD